MWKFWLDPAGAGFYLAGCHSCMSMECRGARWHLSGQECDGSWRIYFEPGTAEFMDKQEPLFRHVTELLLASEVPARLLAHPGKKDGRDPTVLEKRRGEALIRELARRGVDAGRLTMAGRAFAEAPEPHKVPPGYLIAEHTDAWIEIERCSIPPCHVDGRNGQGAQNGALETAFTRSVLQCRRLASASSEFKSS